jgi:hypothetical protein
MLTWQLTGGTQNDDMASDRWAQGDDLSPSCGAGGDDVASGRWVQRR